jgi:hypothetical protein
LTRRRYLVGLAAASLSTPSLALTWLLATAALASSAGQEVPGLPGRPGGVDLHNAGSAVIKSGGFAGYRRNGGGTNASFSIKATFVVPDVTGCGSATRAIAPGIDVSNAQTTSGVGLFVGCYKGTPDYFPFIDLNGSNSDYAAGTVQPGDHIALRLSEGPSTAELTFQDLTHNLIKVKTGSGLKGLGLPGIGDDSWDLKHAELGVPNFGTIVFGRCVVNGAALGSGGSAKSPAVREYDRTKAGTLQIQTGPLTLGGQAFSTYFRHS